MQQKYFTLMIVPDANAQVKRIQVRRGLVYGGVLTAMGLLAAVFALVVHYSYIVSEVFEADALRNKNVALQQRLDAVQNKIAQVESQFAKVERLDERLRMQTGFSDEGRNLHLGTTEHQRHLDFAEQSNENNLGQQQHCNPTPDTWVTREALAKPFLRRESWKRQPWKETAPQH